MCRLIHSRDSGGVDNGGGTGGVNGGFNDVHGSMFLGKAATEAKIIELNFFFKYFFSA